ncbi:hypothetical protein Ddye_026514 [Dipteronia dyeriana]|uniref:CCHC-type domain-containing protein n=1 Tax=Dipteronia dyeriana TaxID=168575 RepID=A0AAD9TN99_9ROSI|nr:hypothetical protein Ddye_026514 [Dipteronia dyeriana]
MKITTLTKSLNFNLPIKLGKLNYLYWKEHVLPIIQALDLEDYLCGNLYSTIHGQNHSTQNQLQSIKKGSDSISDFALKIKHIGDASVVAEEEVKDHDLVMCLVNGICHDFDAIVVVITTQQRFMSFEDAQFVLMMHEQRLEHLDSPSRVEIGQISANYTSNNNQEKKGQRDFNYQGNRGGYRERGRSKWTGGRSRIHCQVCNKPGHNGLKCYHRFDEAYQGPPPYDQQLNQALFHQQQN